MIFPSARFAAASRASVRSSGMRSSGSTVWTVSMCSVSPSPSRVISLTVATNRAKPRWQTPTLEAAETLCAARSASSRLSPS